jgi:regulator of replication initiation timing
MTRSKRANLGCLSNLKRANEAKAAKSSGTTQTTQSTATSCTSGAAVSPCTRTDPAAQPRSLSSSYHNALKREDRAKGGIAQLKASLLEANQSAYKKIAEFGSLCAGYHSALADAQTTVSQLSEALAQASAQASSHADQHNALLQKLSALSYQSSKDRQKFKAMESSLLQRLNASCAREHKYLQSISELETHLEGAVNEKKRLQLQCNRFPNRMQRAIEKIKKKAKCQEQVFKVRRKRKIPDLVQHLIMDLTAAGVTSNSMFKVIELVGKAMGFQIRGHIAGRAVNQIVEEGGIAAEMQLMYKAQNIDSE